MAVLPGLAEKTGRNNEGTVRRGSTVPGWPDLISDSSSESEMELERVIHRLFFKFEFINFISVLFYLIFNLP